MVQGLRRGVLLRQLRDSGRNGCQDYQYAESFPAELAILGLQNVQVLRDRWNIQYLQSSIRDVGGRLPNILPHNLLRGVFLAETLLVAELCLVGQRGDNFLRRKYSSQE